jgi:hypothetical protein
LKLLAILLLVVISTTTFAQNDDNHHRIIVSASDTEIAFYQVDAAGQKTSVGSLPSGIIFAQEPQPDQWTVSFSYNFTISPNGQQIAFTAQRKDEINLFIYTLQDSHLEQISIPRLLYPQWSPDGHALLLTPCCVDPGTEQDYTNYTYDLREDRLTPLNTTGFGWLFRWLPDSKSIVYGSFDGLFKMSRDETSNEMLLDLSDVPSQNDFDFICGLEWSEAEQRFYYVRGCGEETEQPNEILYSTNLQGTTKQEFESSLSMLYPNEKGATIIDFFVEGDTKFFFILSHDIDYSNQIYWRIAQFTEGQLIDVYFEPVEQDPYITVSAMSPDSSKIAVVSHSWKDRGLILVVDTANGAELVNEEFTTIPVCDVEWIDSENLLYTVSPEEICDPFYTSSPLQIVHLNVSTQKTTPITDDSRATSWIIREPD